MAAQMAKQVTWVMAIDRCEVRSKRWLCHRSLRGMFDRNSLHHHSGNGFPSYEIYIYICLAKRPYSCIIGTTGTLDLILLGNVKLGRSWP